MTVMLNSYLLREGSFRIETLSELYDLHNWRRIDSLDLPFDIRPNLGQMKVSFGPATRQKW